MKISVLHGARKQVSIQVNLLSDRLNSNDGSQHYDNISIANDVEIFSTPPHFSLG